jgi:hypothetical protein
MRRPLLLLVAALLAGTPAVAQQKGKKGKPPAAEVVPAAPAKPEESPRPAKALPEKECPTCPDVDRALARAVTWAFEPAPEEIRALAIEDLGLLADPRALNVLAGLVLDPNPRLGQAALRAIRSFQHPRAQEILENVVRYAKLDDGIRIEALEALAFQRTATAREFLESVRDDREGRFGSRLAATARTVLSQWGDAGAPLPPR